MARGSRRLPKYSLYSTDSEEDQVGAANRGLDRCAALLRTIASTDKHRKVPTKQAPPMRSARGEELGPKRAKPRFPGDKAEPALRPGATSTPVLAHRSTSHHTAPPADSVSCTTVGVNRKTKRRRITAHRRLKSEPALDVKKRAEGARKTLQTAHGNNSIHRHGVLTPPPGPTTAKVGHHSDPRHLGTRHSAAQSTHSQHGDSPDRPPVPPSSLTPRPAPASVPPAPSGSYSYGSSGPYPLPPPHSLPPWLFHPAYFPPHYPPPTHPHITSLPPYNAPQHLPPHPTLYPHLTLPNASCWNRSRDVQPQSSRVSESAPSSSQRASLVEEGSRIEEAEEEDLSQVVQPVLVERLGKALVELQAALQTSGVSHHHLKPLRRSVRLFQALSLHMQGGGVEDSPAHHHNELLSRIQSLQNDNNSLQERLTQCELALQKANAEMGKLEGENTALQQKVGAVTAERDKRHNEYQNAMRESGQLQSQLEMSQSEVRMMRMALAEKESEVTRAYDETLALRHCIASFLTEITREQHTSEVGWKVPLSVMQKFQDLADDGNSQKFLEALGTEALPSESDDTESTLLGDFSPSLNPPPPEGAPQDHKDVRGSPASSSSLTDLLDNGLDHMKSTAHWTPAKLAPVEGCGDGREKKQLDKSVRDASFMSGSTAYTTSSERQFRRELASLDAEIARLQLQFQVTANRTKRTIL